MHCKLIPAAVLQQKQFQNHSLATALCVNPNSNLQLTESVEQH